MFRRHPALTATLLFLATVGLYVWSKPTPMTASVPAPAAPAPEAPKKAHAWDDVLAAAGKRELVEVAGFVGEDDARLQKLPRVVSIGGYAEPLSRS